MAFEFWQHLGKYPIRNLICATIVTVMFFVFHELIQGLGHFVYPVVFILSYMVFAFYLATMDNGELLRAINTQ